jgi:hypothetical protein
MYYVNTAILMLMELIELIVVGIRELILLIWRGIVLCGIGIGRAFVYFYATIFAYGGALLVLILGTQLSGGTWYPLITQEAMYQALETTDPDTIMLASFFSFGSILLSFIMICIGTLYLLYKLWFLVIPTTIIGFVSLLIYLVFFGGCVDFVKTYTYLFTDQYVNFYSGKIHARGKTLRTGEEIVYLDMYFHESYMFGDKYKRYPESEMCPFWVADVEFHHKGLKGYTYQSDEIQPMSNLIKIYYDRHPNDHKSLTTVKTVIGKGDKERVVSAIKYVINEGDAAPKGIIDIPISAYTPVGCENAPLIDVNTGLPSILD